MLTGNTCLLLFFFNDTATTEIYTLSLHDALPISKRNGPAPRAARGDRGALPHRCRAAVRRRDRKSTRLNSSHLVISYAVFCLKKKKKCNQRSQASAQQWHRPTSSRQAA